MNKKVNKKDDNNDQMTFWEHLDELRGVLIRGIIAIVILAIVAFSFKNILFDDIILGPGKSDFISYRALCAIGKYFRIDSFCFEVKTLKFINITLSGQFMSHITAALMAGLIAASPYVVFEFWRFIRPGLTSQERSRSRGMVVSISVLFLTGILFSYFIVVPLMVNFLGNYQVSELVPNQITLSSFTSSVTTMCLMMGLMFEFPVIMIFLTKIGIITPQLLRKYRKHTFVVILIVSGLITPSPDIFSQLIVTIPLYLLFEISLVLSSRVYRRRIQQEENDSTEV